MKRPSGMAVLLVILLVFGISLVSVGWINLDQYLHGFKPIFPDGIQVYGEPSIKESVKVAMDFDVSEGTKSLLSVYFDFLPIEEQTYTFAIAMPYHVHRVQEREPHNSAGKVTWDYRDALPKGSLITVNFTPIQANRRALLIGYFTIDEAMAVHDRGKYTAIIPIHLASNIVGPPGLERLDRAPTTVSVSIPTKSIPAGDSYPHPDKIIFREDSQGRITKGLIWHFNSSKSSEIGQTILASYIIPEVMDIFNLNLFYAALFLSIGSSTAVSSSIEILREVRSRKHANDVNLSIWLIPAVLLAGLALVVMVLGLMGGSTILNVAQVTASVASAVFVAFAALQARSASRNSAESASKSIEAMEKWSDTLIRPRIMVRATTYAERQNWLKFHGSGIGTVIQSPGIRVDNVGLGPAINGNIYVVLDNGTKIRIEDMTETGRTFVRIPPGWVYMYPSDTSPYLRDILNQHFQGRDKIRIQVEYYDINDKPYKLRPEEEIIEIIRT